MIAEAAPSVAATIAVQSASVQSGKSADVKVTVKRTKAFKAKLQLAAKNLPEGVTATPVDVPDKDGEVTLKLTANADAKPVSQPFTLVLREMEGGTEHPAQFSLVAASENNGVPQGYTELIINSTDQLWLTVSTEPVKSEEPKTGKKK